MVVFWKGTSKSNSLIQQILEINSDWDDNGYEGEARGMYQEDFEND